MGETITLDWVGTGDFGQPLVSVDITPISEDVQNYINRTTQDQASFVPESEDVRGHAEQVARRVERPDSIFVSDLEGEQQLRKKTAELIGRVGVAETAKEAVAPMTLKEAAQRAKRGDLQARELVKTNVNTDYMERTYKTKNVIRVVLTADEDGKLMQHGQTIEDVNINTLEHLKSDTLKNRGKIEAHNAVRQQYCYENGILKDNAILTWSTVFDEITRNEAEDLGYFTQNMSCAAQLLTEEEGEVVLYSAFVAGADSADGARFDFEAIVAASAELGLDYSDMGSNEILSHPGLVPKDLLPDLILTVVEKYDEHVPGEHARFFGRIHQGERDYRGHMRECQRRETHATQHVERVTQNIIEASDSFVCATDATELLDKLNDKVLKKNIVRDTTIESNVLGNVAQKFVEEARLHVEAGNEEATKQAQAKVEQYGKSSSCPKDPATDSETNPSGRGLKTENSESTTKKRWMGCPFCNKSDACYGDPCGPRLECRFCKALVVNSKVVSTGNSKKPKGGQASEVKKSPENVKQVETQSVAKEASLEVQVDKAFKEQGMESFEAEKQKVNVQQVGQLALVG